jgi:hypothetical protein
MIMIELTEPLQSAVEGTRNSEPVRVVNPRTREEYVLLRAEVYEKVKNLFADGPLSEEERRAIIAGVWRRAGWDDPAMDDYAQLIKPRA